MSSARMPMASESRVATSVFTLPNTTSACFSEAASYTGANAFHAPHQVAQKSTMTIRSCPMMS